MTHHKNGLISYILEDVLTVASKLQPAGVVGGKEEQPVNHDIATSFLNQLANVVCQAPRNEVL